MITLRAAVRHERDAAPQPVRPERARPDLRVVDEAVRRATSGRRGEERDARSAGGVVGTLLVVLLFVCVFGVVVFQVFLVQTQSHLDQLDRDISSQEARAKDLRLQTTDLEAPDRIVKDAKDRLGMIAPGDVVYLQPGAGDDAKAAFDPARETPPSTVAPGAAPSTGATATKGASTGTAGSAAAKGTTPTTAWTPSTTAKPQSTATAPATATTPTSATTPSTATKAAPSTPTTAPRSTTTTVTRTR